LAETQNFMLISNSMKIKTFYVIIYNLVHKIRYSRHIVLQSDLDQLAQGQKLLAAKLEAMEAALRY
jgi:hypothetical protein